MAQALVQTLLRKRVVTFPLFPLTKIVMPGGRLQLRIFKQRYLDMVRDCVKYNTDFGVCLIRDGIEAGAPATVFAYGTAVEITDWCTGENGLLNITTHGKQKFRTISSTVQPNGLRVAEVELIPLAPKTVIPKEYINVANLLRRALKSVEPQTQSTSSNFKDAAWVCGRLIEDLPMSPDERHELMVIDDPIEQLQALQIFISNW